MAAHVCSSLGCPLLKNEKDGITARWAGWLSSSLQEYTTMASSYVVLLIYYTQVDI